jgi:glutamate dehydrogenase
MPLGQEQEEVAGLVDAAVESVDGPPAVVRGLAEAIVRRLPLEDQEPEIVTDRVAHGLEVLTRRLPGDLAVRVQAVDGASVLDVTVDDAPLLLSTVLEELDACGITTRAVLHPVLGVRRDDDGRLLAVRPARTSERREAWLHVRLADRLDDDEARTLRDRLSKALGIARRVHADLPAMRERLRAAVAALRRQPDDEAAEAAALLEWLLDDRLVVLGVAADGEELGVLADDVPAVVPGDPNARVRVGRTLSTSRVHRQERMVDVRVRTGEAAVRVVGLFASQAYADTVDDVPLARRSLERMLDVEDLVEGSHDERALRVLFASLPLEVQLGAPPGELRRTLVPLLAAQRAHEVGLRWRLDSEAKVANVIVTLPRGRFTQRGRERIQAALVDRFNGRDADYHLSITREDWVLLHFVVHAREGRALEQPRMDDLQRHVVSLTRTWTDAVKSLLREQYSVDEARRLADEWLPAFPGGYAEQVVPEVAVNDIAQLDALRESGEPTAMRLSTEGGGRWRARLYLRGAGIELSRLLPVIESLGLVVVDEIPYDVEGWGHLHELHLRAPEGFEPAPVHGQLAAQAALAVLAGRAEADDLNQLVLLAGLGWEDVAILRAYRRYRRQLGTGFTESYQNTALREHPAVARALVELFAAAHDPRFADDERAEETARTALAEALEQVQRLDQDRILRNYAGLVEATLRTNRYVRPRRAWLTLKFDSERVPEAGKPTPHVETYVYSPSFEGIHLRGGPVARGGIRHSDRQEDVRAEVLDLMKAQMTKNALIVPVGAKGGFVLKGPLGPDPSAAVRTGYERFVKALLDVTDNIVDGEVRHPEGVRVHDDEDPYLVVAPDRGTGTFSDLANEVAAERDFWLGDAFASGGSRGYDHKGMGITARGAWVAVTRHFAELGVDVRSDPVSVIGVGDMSGDVFGNGMLRSRALRLVAAFDHRDIFIDPDPDPERSFEERKRLFSLPRSSWHDYDPALISAGGGVWSRTVKAIPLSAEVRELLRVPDEVLSPPELIQAILRAPADLLFAGGVGTFVKESGESNAEVGDRANDAIRIDAKELSVRVVGEGANLALTQRARIQYSRRGGRCNTDAVDNAAGVATSDAEVNLKILLAGAADAGLLEPGERDRLLAAASDDVAARVLADVDMQTSAVSRELLASPGGLEAYEELMADLERRERLDRGVEALPDSGEVERRRRAEAGLTRPELSVLLAYAKLDLRDALLDAELVDDPGVRPLLLRYLPPSLRARFGDLMDEHRLRRELIATSLANAAVNDMGITWARRAGEELGVDPAGATRAYWIAREVTGAALLWADIADLGSEVEHSAVHELDETVRGVVDACARAYARQHRTDETVETVVAQDGAVAASMAELSSVEGARERAAVARWCAAGVPRELALRVAALPDLAPLPDVAAVSRRHGRSAADVLGAFRAATDLLPLRRLEAVIDRMAPEARWSRWQREGLIDELRRIRRDTVTAALGEPGSSGAQAVEQWLAGREPGRQRVDRLVTDLESEGPGLDGAAVAVRALRDAVADDLPSR